MGDDDAIDDGMRPLDESAASGAPDDDPQVRLRERIKELRCLYDVLALTSDKLAAVGPTCARVLDVLLRSYLHEDRVVARIALHDIDLRSRNWREGDAPPGAVIEQPIICHGAVVGMLTVGYRTDAFHSQTFLPEEREMTAAVAAHVAKMVEDRFLFDRVRQGERTRTIGQMTSGLAHDFNNLLTVIIGSAESLRENLAPGDPNLAHARLIAEAAERGSRITAQLLAYTRRQPLSPQAIALGPMLRAVERLLLHALGAGIRFELDVPADIWPVHADRTQLENALLNLAVNARDAMPQGGRFRVAASNVTVDGDGNGGEEDLPLAEGDYVRFAVSDTGVGMSEEVAARAFDPFFTTKDGRGSGLGLSGVFGFVHQSHGQIRLSTAPGQGAVFVFYLPRSREVVAGPASPPAPVAAPGCGERILLVEDENLLRRLTVSVLTKLGYQVTAVPTVDEALARLAVEPGFDLLFGDVAVSGTALAQRAIAADPALGVLLTSGFDEGAENREAQPFVFIAKPYRRAELAEKIAEALARRPKA